MWNEARVLVTGSEGFLGKPLVARLEALGAEVIPFDLAFGDDVTDARSVSDAVFQAKPTHIFHLAGNSIVDASAGSPWSSVNVNAFGTLNILEVARAYMENNALRAVVCSSSNHIYGKQAKHPYREDAQFNHYGAYSVGKIAADYFTHLYAKEYGVPAVAIRHTNTYGPEDIHDSHIVRGTILSLMAGEQPVIRSEGVTRKGYLYIDDTVDAYLIAARAPEKNIIALNASSADSYSAREIVDIVKDVMGSEAETRIDGVGTNEEDEALDSTLILNLGWEQKYYIRSGIKKTVEAMTGLVPA